MIRAIYRRYVLAYWFLLLARIERRNGCTDKWVRLWVQYAVLKSTSLGFYYWGKTARIGKIKRKP